VVKVVRRTDSASCPSSMIQEHATMSAVPDSAEPAPQGDSTPVTGAREPAPVPPQPGHAAPRPPWGWAAVFVMGAALATGFFPWGIGEIMHDYYGASVEARRNRFAFDRANREQGIADRKNAAIAFGTFGALLGLLVGAAGGALRRSVPAASSAAVAGLLLGGVGAALAGYELVPIFAHFYSDEQPSLLLPTLVRGGIWAVAGLAAGFALGWGWHGPRGIPGAVIGGLVGSILATIAFEVANGLIFPADRNDAVIP